MKKLLLVLISLLIILPVHTGFAQSNTKEYRVGIDIPAGDYTVELYQSEYDEHDIGIAICSIIRFDKETYKIETIQTDDMFLTDDNPTCKLTLYDDDRLSIVYGEESYSVRLISHTADGFTDEYPGVIDGVNLTQAFNECISVMTSDEATNELFPGLLDVEFEYDPTLPSINIMLYFESKDNIDAETMIFRTMVLLNTACNQQNPDIAEATVYDYGGIYDDLFVVIGIYDKSVLLNGTMDTYYVMPNSTIIKEFD